jgi:hypothetical protein
VAGWWTWVICLWPTGAAGRSGGRRVPALEKTGSQEAGLLFSSIYLCPSQRSHLGTRERERGLRGGAERAGRPSPALRAHSLVIIYIYT